MNTRSIQELLQTSTIFKDLTDCEIEPIIELAKSRKYKRGTHIFMQDDPLTNVYFIHSGQIKIYKTDLHGKEQIVNMLQSGDMFPHQGFFRQDNYPAHAKADDDAILTYIPIQSFENILLTHPETCIKLFRVLGDIIMDLHNRLEEKILHNTYEQIVMLILRLGKQLGVEMDNNHVRIQTPFTNRELANMIGSSRETISRTLTQLKKQELMAIDHEGSMLLDVNRLKDELF